MKISYNKKRNPGYFSDELDAYAMVLDHGLVWWQKDNEV